MSNYMKINEYAPNPFGIIALHIPPELMQLAKTLARNVHENWAAERIKQGWKYGAERNDIKKEHPCLIAYEELPEEEKDYDRKTAMETIKVILGMGYGIERE